MKRFCRCHQWSDDADKLNALVTAFLHCPWCGIRLVAPCIQCNKLSDTHTGNTLYWRDEHNFCSPGCVMEYGVTERRN